MSRDVHFPRSVHLILKERLTVVCDSSIEVFDEDLALCQRTASGDRDAGRELALRLLARVRTSVRYAIGVDEELADHVQHCLAEVLRAARGYRGDCPLEQFADRVVYRSLMRDLHRRRRRERTVVLEDAEPEERAEGADEILWRRRLQRRLTLALQSIPLDRRLAVTLHWVHGYTIREIAKLTDTRVNTVRGRLRTAKKELREAALKDPVLSEWLEERNHGGRR